jgi:hypothetical protein
MRQKYDSLTIFCELFPKREKTSVGPTRDFMTACHLRGYGIIDSGFLGYRRTTPQIALKAAKICTLVGITDLFRVVTGLRMGGAIARRYCAWQIAPGEFLKSLDSRSNLVRENSSLPLGI